MDPRQASQQRPHHHRHPHRWNKDPRKGLWSRERNRQPHRPCPEAAGAMEKGHSTVAALPLHPPPAKNSTVLSAVQHADSQHTYETEYTRTPFFLFLMVSFRDDVDSLEFLCGLDVGIAYVYGRHREAAVVGLLLHEVQGYPLAGHIRDAGVFKAIEL